MPARQRIVRDQLVRQAEGYLELGMAEHALRSLARMEGAGTVRERVGETRLDAQTCYLRGAALRALKRYDEAIPWLEQAGERMPDSIHIWLALGWCYKRTGRLDQSVDALETAIEVDPSEAILHYNLACYCCLLGDKVRALACLSQAFEIDANFRDLVHDEPDFDPLRDDPDFQVLSSVIV